MFGGHENWARAAAAVGFSIFGSRASFWVRRRKDAVASVRDELVKIEE